MTAMPGMSRLFLDYCSGAISAFLPLDDGRRERLPIPPHWPEIVRLLSAQNPSANTAPALASLAKGAGTIVTGQQVGLFGGPLFTPFKAATTIARARQATAAGHPHAAIFWLATEDHDFDEIDHVTGGMISRAEIGGATATRRADTCSTTGCPANDSDC